MTVKVEPKIIGKRVRVTNNGANPWGLTRTENVTGTIVAIQPALDHRSDNDTVQVRIDAAYDNEIMTWWYMADHVAGYNGD